MTDNTENPQKKANLIKQPKVRPQAAPLESAEPASAVSVGIGAPGTVDHDALGEKRKVVVVKKKIVIKKPQARVVAHHDDGAAPVEEKAALPNAVQAQVAEHETARGEAPRGATARSEAPRAEAAPPIETACWPWGRTAKGSR